MGWRPDPVLCGTVVGWGFFQQEVICTSRGSWFYGLALTTSG